MEENVKGVEGADLKTYVKSVISSIMDAVTELQDEYGIKRDENSTVIGNGPASSAKGCANLSAGNVPMSSVHFEVNLKVSDTSATGGKGGVKLHVISLLVDGSSSQGAETMQKVSFDIPVAYPAIKRG